jgi:hypothetical protein
MTPVWKQDLNSNVRNSMVLPTDETNLITDFTCKADIKSNQVNAHNFEKVSSVTGTFHIHKKQAKLGEISNSKRNLIPSEETLS